MDISIDIRTNRTLGEVQDHFNYAFPFLKIEFYKKPGGLNESRRRQRLNKSDSLRLAGVKTDGILTINDMMTVGQLENIFRDQFGAIVQVSRKSGEIWLETTMTDSWTLKQQNDHGRELSVPLKIDPTGDEIDYD